MLSESSSDRAVQQNALNPHLNGITSLLESADEPAYQCSINSARMELDF